MLSPLLLLPALALHAAAALPPPTRADVVVYARGEFRKGDFQKTLSMLEEAEHNKELQNLDDRFEAALLQGLSHVYLHQQAEADIHFREVLLANPDFDLDPLTYGEDAKHELDLVRELPELQGALAKRRDEIRQAKAQDEELKRLAEEAERKRRELAAIPERVPSVERHNPLLNFLPFGVPQIDQERITPGVLFAVAEGVSLTATVLTFTQVQSYVDVNGKVSQDDQTKARNWRLANWISVGLAAAVYVGGVVDAFVAYRDRTVRMVPREEYLKLRQEGPGKDYETPAVPAKPAPYPKPSASLYLVPLPDGAAAGIVGRF